MDRLRALQYFISAAQEGSLSAAARKLEVTVPAVAKMVATLEKDLGVTLFERSAQGLILTTAGEDYLVSCRPAVQQLDDADELMRGSSKHTRGTVVVGIQHFMSQTIFAPALPRFHARYPEITIDFHDATQVTQENAPGVDLFISLGWPTAPDMVHRAFPMSRFIVCAAPSYWKKHGQPRHPNELLQHNCFLLRTQTGTVMDLWHFQRGEEKVSVTVKGWAVASNVHRDSILRMARAGEGVVRVLGWSSREDLSSQTLVTALDDWSLPDAPPVNLSYRPSARKVARVRVLIDFIMETFRDLEQENAKIERVAREAPHWANVRQGRASATVGRKTGRRR
jgi:DNA-binding transcriptional LysR family regulator